MPRRGADQLSMFGREHLPMSPVRRQYLELKSQHPDAVLFFRLGDFYETFDADAELVARELEIALTSRELGRGERVPMAGVPCAAVDTYLARLIERGLRVAICEQLSEPNGRGPVERGVVRIVSPGTVVEDGLLAARQNSFLAAIVDDEQSFGLAHLDVSTGYLAVCELTGADRHILLGSELCRIGPSECLLASGATDPGALALLPPGCRATVRSDESFGARRAEDRLRGQFGVRSLESLGLEATPLGARASAALLEYVAETLPGALDQFDRLRTYDARGYMVLDSGARRNLELTSGLRSGERSGSLLEVLDQTQTPMGARLLRHWLTQPLCDLDEIRARHGTVAVLLLEHAGRREAADELAKLPDLERLASRLFQGRLSPRDCLSLARGLAGLPKLHAAIRRIHSAATWADLDAVEEITRLVTERLNEEPPAVVGVGVIRGGINGELDEARALSGDARRWIADLERRERERTGVRGLRVAHNRVFGYFIELAQSVSRQPTDYYQRQQTGANQIDEHLQKLGYIRKQTLAGVERYLTAELKDYELRAGRAEQEAERLERQLFAELLEQLRPFADRVRTTAADVARLDCLVALAQVAYDRQYVRPELDGSCDLEIVGGRHPIVEAALAPGEFVPNDVALSEHGPRLLVVTGPNMAGKSTILRQVALIALLAQIGSFVPAERARLGLVDRVFTRIGAQDDLAGQRSTFMVEMTETANILRNATPRSLVVLDEVGRGTSTYDGLALARAILEYLHSSPRLSCRALFATHFHELASLETELEHVQSVRMDVQEHGKDVVFLHRLVPGAADRSYGIHVARLAGVPAEVTARAEAVLVDLEDRPGFDSLPRTLSSDERTALAVLDRLRTLDVLRLSPLQAHAELLTLLESAGLTDDVRA